MGSARCPINYTNAKKVMVLVIFEMHPVQDFKYINFEKIVNFKDCTSYHACSGDLRSMLEPTITKCAVLASSDVELF